MFEWPSHSWISFIEISFASISEAQEWRRSWKRIFFSPFRSRIQALKELFDLRRVVVRSYVLHCLGSVCLVARVGWNHPAFYGLLECKMHHRMIPLGSCTGKSVIPEWEVECVDLIAGQFFEGNAQLLEVWYDPSVRHSFVAVIRKDGDIAFVAFKPFHNVFLSSAIWTEIICRWVQSIAPISC